MKRTNALFVAIICCAFLTGCPLQNITKPTIPPDPPAPAIEPSSINVPITSIPLAPLATQIDQQVPPGDDGANAWDVLGNLPNGIPVFGGDAYGEEHRIWRDPLSVSLNGNQLSITAIAHYWARGGVDVENGAWGIGGYSWHTVAQCGSDATPNNAILNIVSLLSIADDYTLRGNSHATPVNCQQPCLLTILNIDYTGKVSQLFQSKLNAAASFLDSKLPGVTAAKGYCESAWNMLQSPIQIDQNVWLLINPATLSASPLNGSGTTASLTVGIVAHPQIVIGSKPPAGTVPLPPLGAGVSGNTFHVALDAELPFTVATEMISNALVGQAYPLGGHSIKINSAAVYGSGAMAVLQVGIVSPFKGTVFFTGKPSFDAVKDILSINDLNYSLETSNVLAKAASWVLHSEFLSLLNNKLNETPNGKPNWGDVSSQVAASRAKLQANLNQNYGTAVQTTGSITDLNLLGIYSTPTSWKVRLVTDGTLQVNVSP
jgi:hypothetical protein